MYPRSYAQYTLLERLASGGMSELDLARRTVDEAGYVRFLVVKRIKANMLQDESFVRMFKDEARITSELRHTNIAQVYDFGRVDDEYFLALEYVAGTDLRAVLSTLRAERRRMPVRMVLRVAREVLDALQYAHTRTDAMGRPMEVVHRDVNPRNIMVSLSGEVKLIDFGVARATDRLERTQTDHFKGKIAYMAPEQVTGADLDHRVDIFAMGLTLYEMLTGRGAFAGLDQTQILYRILQGQLPKLDVPREWGSPGRALADLVDRALAHEPADRFASAAAMAEAVDRTASAFGGMPTQGEVAAWLREVEPGLEGRIRTKMERLSGELSGVQVLPEELDNPPTEERTDTLVNQTRPNVADVAPEDTTGTGTMRAPVMVAAAGVGTVTVLVLVLLGLVIISAAGVAVGVAAWPALTKASPEATAVQEIPPSTDPAEQEPVEPLQIYPPPRPYDPADAGAGGQSAGSNAGGTTSAGERVRPDREPAGTGAEAAADAGDAEGEGAESVEAADAGDAEGGTLPEGAEGEASSEGTAEPAEATPAEALPTGKLQVTAAQKGLQIYIDGEPTPHRTGEQFEWPVGEHTVSAEGLAPATVQVKAGLFAFVPLKPEG